MTIAKYTSIGGVIKQISSEYTSIGGVIKQITINAVGIGGDIKQIPLGQTSIWAGEYDADRIYGITEPAEYITGYPVYGDGITNPYAIRCDPSGNIYVACHDEIRKYNSSGVKQWTYTGHAVPIYGLCLENRSGTTYIYSGDIDGKIKCLVDNGSSAGVAWSTDASLYGICYALAIDTVNGHIYAATGGTVGWVVRLQRVNGIATGVYNQVEDVISIGIDDDLTSLYIGDADGHLRKISTGGYEYWDQDKGGEIQDALIGPGGYGYYTNGPSGDVGKFTTSDGSNIWTATPAGTSHSVAVDAFGNVYSTHGACGSRNAVIRKYDEDGNEQWTWQHYDDSEWKRIAVTPGLKSAGF